MLHLTELCCILKKLRCTLTFLPYALIEPHCTLLRYFTLNNTELCCTLTELRCAFTDLWYTLPIYTASSWVTLHPNELKGTWQWGGFSGVFADIGSSWVRYTNLRAVPILASNSQRYSYSKNDSPLSPIRGVAYSAYQWYGESPTPRITDTESRLLNSLKENSLYQWYGESSTPPTSDRVSRRLPVSLSRRVADSAFHRYGESTTLRIVESESRRLRVLVIRGVTIWRKKFV